MSNIVPITVNKIPSSLNECNLQHLLSLIQHHKLFDDAKINPFKKQIIGYLQKNQIDGAKLSQIPRKKFSENLIQFCDNNKKARGPSNKAWDIFNSKYVIITSLSSFETEKQEINLIITTKNR